MKLSERWDYIKQFKRKWEAHPGVQVVRVGYERYGMQSDLEVIEDMMHRENNYFKIEKLGTPSKGQHAKPDRIRRLEPDIREGRFYFPCVAWHGDFGSPGHRICYWSIWTEAAKTALDNKITAAEAAGDTETIKALQPATADNVGQIIFRPMRGLTSRQKLCGETAQKFRIVTALQRQDENGDIYDLTRIFFDELVKHPFSSHDDLIDAASRIYDLDPQPPVAHEAKATESIEQEGEELAEG